MTTQTYVAIGCVLGALLLALPELKSLVATAWSKVKPDAKVTVVPVVVVTPAPIDAALTCIKWFSANGAASLANEIAAQIPTMLGSTK